MAANPQFRLLYVIWAFFECLLFGGLLFGWGSIVFILKEDGVYSEICDGYGELKNTSETEDTVVSNSSTPAVTSSTITNSNQSANVSGQGEIIKQNLNCPDRDRLLTLAFTIGSMVFCVGGAVMGHITHRFGIRITRLCAFVCLSVGAVLTGFTSHEVPWLIFPGLSLLGVGGFPLLMTNMQFSVLFTKGSSTVISMMSGAFDASSAVMLIAKLAHEWGFAFQWYMLVICGLHISTLVNTFFFLPRNFITKTVLEPAGEDATSKEAEAGIEPTGTTNPQNDDQKGVKIEKGTLSTGTMEMTAKLPPLSTIVSSPVYFLHVIWMSVLQLRFYYFLGSLNSWLNTLFDSEEEVSYYTNVCLYATMCSVVTSPVAGIIYDIHMRIFATMIFGRESMKSDGVEQAGQVTSDCSRSKLRRDLMPAVNLLVFTSLVAIILSVLVMVDDESVLYTTFILIAVFRSFTYSLSAAYIGVMFANEQFAVLYGLMIILSGIFSLLQYGLFSWAEAYGFLSVDGFLIGLMAASLVHPAYQWFLCHRAESQVTVED